MSLPSPGTDAPDFTIAAAVSGRTISKESLAGKQAVLVFHGPKTTDAPKAIGKAVRAEHPNPDVVVANIVDLRAMAGMFKKLASAQIGQQYNRLAEKLGEDKAPDYVVICADFDNAVGGAFGIDDANSQAAVVVLDGAGTVKAAAQGDGLEQAAIAGLA